MDVAGIGQPGAQALVVCAIAFALALLRSYRIAITLAAISLSWVLLCSTPAFAEFLRMGLIADYPQRVASSYPTADIIVVLGGDHPLQTSSDPNAEAANTGTTRIGFGLELYRAKRAPIVLLTGAEGSATGMALQLTQRGVPSSAMQLESRSLTTHEDAAFSAEFLRNKHHRRILLVTSVWAIRRAAACFRRQGIEVIPAPPLESSQRRPVYPSWRPQHSALQQSGRYLHEYIGFWVYRIRGWV